MRTKLLLGAVVVASVGCNKIYQEPAPIAPTIVGRTYGCIGDNISLKVLEISGQTPFGVKYFWYKEGETIPFYEGKKIDYVIKKAERFVVKSCNYSGVFSKDGAEVNIDVVSIPAPITHIEHRYVETIRVEKPLTIEQKLIFSTSKFKDTMTFTVISPQAETTYMDIKFYASHGTMVGVAIVLRKELELKAGENIVSVDLKNEANYYHVSPNRLMEFSIVVNGIVMKKHIYLL